jgi:hypothetical protein
MRRKRVWVSALITKKNWLISHAGFLAVIKIGWVLVSEKND